MAAARRPLTESVIDTYILNDTHPSQGQLQLIANNASGTAVTQGPSTGPVSGGKNPPGSEDSSHRVEPASGSLPDPTTLRAAIHEVSWKEPR